MTKFKPIRAYSDDVDTMRTTIKNILMKKHPEVPHTLWTDAQLFKKIVEHAIQ